MGESGAPSLVSPETITIGLLESLWHMTATSAPQGDIGKHRDDDIAEYLGWRGDAGEIVSALVETGWLDPHKSCRLLVHDWQNHAPKYIKGGLAKQRSAFFLGEPMGLDLNGEPQRMDPKVPSPKANPSNLIKSNLFFSEEKGNKNYPKRKVTSGSGDPSPEFLKFWDLYPARNGKKLEKALTAKSFELLSNDDRASCVLAAGHYASSRHVREGIGIKDPKRFLLNVFWKDWIEPEQASDAAVTNRDIVQASIAKHEAENKQQEGRDGTNRLS